MNTKDYINYFPEISGLSVEDQEDVLEKARYEALVKLNLSGISAFYFICSLVLVFSFVAASAFYFGYQSLYNIIALGLGIFVQLKLIRWLNGRLLHKGLKSVLSENGV